MRPYTLSEDNYLAAQYLHSGSKSLIFSAVIAAGYAALVFSTIDFVTAAFASGVVTVLIITLPPPIRRYRQRKVFHEQKGLHDSFTISFDDQFLEWKCESGNARIRWEHFLRYKEDDQIFVLYESRNLMRIVPKEAFTDDAELVRFREKLVYIGPV